MGQMSDLEYVIEAYRIDNDNNVRADSAIAEIQLMLDKIASLESRLAEALERNVKLEDELKKVQTLML
jgi:hypothetical protein